MKFLLAVLMVLSFTTIYSKTDSVPEFNHVTCKGISTVWAMEDEAIGNPSRATSVRLFDVEVSNTKLGYMLTGSIEVFAMRGKRNKFKFKMSDITLSIGKSNIQLNTKTPNKTYNMRGEQVVTIPIRFLLPSKMTSKKMKILFKNVTFCFYRSDFH